MEADGRLPCGSFLRIAVTVPFCFHTEAELITAKLRSNEAHYVHIRKPGITEEEIEQLLTEIPEELHCRLCLHDGFSLARKYNVGGVHLNHRNSTPPDKWTGRISRSCHSIDDVKSCEGFNYVTLSPVYPSLSKPGYTGSLDLKKIKAYLSGPHSVPVVALGGITEDRINALRNMGFDGAAMLGDAWRHRFSAQQFCLQFITNPVSIDDAITQAKEALAGGCRWIQLRWKDAPIARLTEAACHIAIICHAAGAIFLLDDHVELVGQTDADGVHLGKNDMPLNKARRLLGPDKIIGATANTTEDIMAAAQAGADYIGYGPFRFTTTKKNLSPVLGLDGYRKAALFRKEHNLRLPLVAIGGITRDDIAEIIEAGADGIALSGSIVNAKKPAEATAEIMNIINNINTEHT